MSRNNGSNEETNLDIVERFDTYEDYLDSQLTATDLGYLDDEEMGRQLVELGYRGMGDTIRREDFDSRKRLLIERTNQKSSAPKQLASLVSLNGYYFILVVSYFLLSGAIDNSTLLFVPFSIFLFLIESCTR